MEPIGQFAVVVSAEEPALVVRFFNEGLDVRVRGRVRAEHDCGSIRLGRRGCAPPRPVRERNGPGAFSPFCFLGFCSRGWPLGGWGDGAHPRTTTTLGTAKPFPPGRVLSRSSDRRPT